MIRRAFERLLRTPGVTIFSIVAIAIGIAATTAVYSAIQGLLVPPGMDRFDRVVNVYKAPLPNGRGDRLFTPEEVEHLRAGQTSFAHLAAWTRVRAELAVDRVAREALCEAVTVEYFRVFEVPPAMGRTFMDADDRLGAPPVAVISHALWRSRFNSDPSVLGRSLVLNGHAFEIVGVAPDWFKGIDMPSIVPTQAWIPLNARAFVVPAGLVEAWSGLQLRAELRPGVSTTAAAAAVRTLGQALPPRERRRGLGLESRAWTVVPIRDVGIRDQVGDVGERLAAAALVVTFVVLLVVSSNLANIQLARMAARRQELAVKLALGARRERLVLEELSEVAVVAIAGGAAGVALAHLLNIVILPWVLSSTNVTIVPADLFGMPLAIAFVALLVVLLVASLAPALHAMRVAPRTTLAQEDAAVSTPRWRGRRVLIVVQVAIAVMLVNIAGLAAIRLIPRVTNDPATRMVTVGLQRMEGRESRRTFGSDALEQINQRVAAGQGLGSLAMSTGLPSGEGGDYMRLGAVDAPNATQVLLIAASGPLFELTGARILRGRALQPHDGRESGSAMVLSETAAQRLFGSIDVVGRTISLGPSLAADSSADQPRTVVGVASDIANGLERNDALAYVPLDQGSHTRVLLLASVTSGAPRAQEELEDLAMRALPDVTVSRAGFGAINRGFDLRFEVIGTLTGSLGVTTLVVAMGGLFGLLSHLVSMRRREMGVRMALGATTRDLLKLIMLQGLRPVALGVVVGLAGAVLLQKGIQPLFMRTLAVNWPALLILPAGFLAIAAVAAYLPARKAASVDPSVALRQL